MHIGSEGTREDGTASAFRFPAVDSVLDGIAALVDQSLLRRLPVQDDEAANAERFGMLETIRAFALEQLTAAGETEAVRRAHAAFVLALAEAVDAGQQTPERATWHRRLDAEHENVRAALGWALESRERETALQIAAALWGYWETRGYLTEGRMWLERALAAAGDADPRFVAAALRGAGALARDQGELDQAQTYGEAALRMFEEAGDERGSPPC